MRLALYEPDIPPNAGTLIRLGACLGVPVEIIEPCGFPISDRAFRRAGLDYIEHAKLRTYRSWESFLEERTPGRIILLSTKATCLYTDFTFLPEDTVMVGRETAGVPRAVHARADGRVLIPMVPAVRSINVAVAAAMVLGEALRQTNGLPAVGAVQGP